MILFKSIIMSLSFVMTASVGYAETLSQKQMLKGIPDFTVSVVKNDVRFRPASSSLGGATDCRAHIESVMCLVDPPENKNEEPGSDRPCLQGGKAYAKYFEALYDNYPTTLQKMFCSLRHIYVEKNFFGTAYAGLVKDETGKSVGAKMGIRKSVLDENLNLGLWASWKEQLSFGGVTDSYTLTPNLPSIQTASHGNLNDFLYFVVAHEFGHIFDFINEINKVKDCPEGTAECEMQEDSWGAISWKTDSTPKPENEFSNRTGLCFYWCDGSALPVISVTQLYEDLHRTDFISIYATTQPWDDFADSLAYFLMYRNLGSSYLIDTKDGNRFDIMSKLASPLWVKKFKYLERFIEADNIIYP